MINLKKALFLPLACLICFYPSMLLADPPQDPRGGGFIGPSVDIPLLSIAEIKKAPDEHYIRVQGNITEYLNSELYVFEDASGTINIEIDDDVWDGLYVHPQDRVEITGEVERDFFSIKVEVDKIRLMPE